MRHSAVGVPLGTTGVTASEETVLGTSTSCLRAQRPPQVAGFPEKARQRLLGVSRIGGGGLGISHILFELDTPTLVVKERLQQRLHQVH